MDREVALRHIELREEGIKNLVAKRDAYMSDLQKFDVSSLSVALIENKIDDINTNIWLLKSGIENIARKFKRQSRQ